MGRIRAMEILIDNQKYQSQPKHRKSDSQNLTVILKTFTDRFTPYLEKRLPVCVALRHFKNVSRLSRLTGISRQSIYRAIESGWFSDYHSRRIEHCANGYLKCELTPESAAIKKAWDSQQRSKRAKCQHALTRRFDFFSNPNRYGVLDMGACQLKRIVRGRESPPPKKRCSNMTSLLQPKRL